MKELSIEEKAKRYDEAIQRARNIVNSINVGLIGKDSFEAVFPELKESEGERIRKELICFLETEIPQCNARDKYIAWLEKQSKASKVEQALREVEEKADAFTETHKGETSDEILAQMRGEQKPAEWSEEDEMLMDELESYILYDKEFNDEQKAWRIKRLKSLKDRYTWKPSDEQMDALRYVTNFDYGGYKAALVSLYEQLKKLKG